VVVDWRWTGGGLVGWRKTQHLPQVVAFEESNHVATQAHPLRPCYLCTSCIVRKYYNARGATRPPGAAFYAWVYDGRCSAVFGLGCIERKQEKKSSWPRPCPCPCPGCFCSLGLPLRPGFLSSALAHRTRDRTLGQRSNAPVVRPPFGPHRETLFFVGTFASCSKVLASMDVTPRVSSALARWTKTNRRHPCSCCVSTDVASGNLW
jgi:hypothetical protein